MSTKALKGGPELLAFLDAFPAKLVSGAVRSGLTAAAKPIRTQARANARKRSGKMAKAIVTGSPKVEQDGTVRVRVYLDPRKPHGFLGYFHEYGVQPHLITVQEQEKPFRVGRDGRRQAYSMKIINRMVRDESLKIGDKFVGPSVQHPGHSAHPFLRPAMDMKADEAVNAFGERIRRYLRDKASFSAPLVEVADDE